MKCPNCGREESVGKPFCPDCGAKLIEEKKGLLESLIPKDDDKKQTVVVEQHNHSCLGGCGTIFVILVIIGMIGNACGSDSGDDDDKSEAAEAAAVSVEYTEADIGEIYEQYELNPLRTEEEYSKVEICGRLDEISMGEYFQVENFNDSSQGFRVYYNHSSDSFKNSVESELKDYNKGDTITVDITITEFETGVFLGSLMEADLSCIVE